MLAGIIGFVIGLVVGLGLGIEALYKVKDEYIKDGRIIRKGKLYKVEPYKP